MRAISISFMPGPRVEASAEIAASFILEPMRVKTISASDFTRRND